MSKSISTPYMTVVIDRANDLVRLTRTDAVYPSLEAMVTSMDTLVAALPLDIPKKLLLDFRQGPTARNDEDFEKASIKVRAKITGRFRVAAVVVRSAVGKLQVARLAKVRGETANVFQDEAEALAFLATK